MQCLQLPLSLEIANTEFAELAKQMAFDDELVIDGSAVTRIDAAGAQLVGAVVTSARAAGSRIRWERPSRLLIDAALTLGLTTWFGLSGERT